MKIVYFDDVDLSDNREANGWITFENKLESTLDVYDYEVTVTNTKAGESIEDIVSEVIDRLILDGMYPEDFHGYD